MSREPTYQFPSSSYPAIRILLWMVVGIIMGHYTQVSLLLLVTAGSTFFIIWALSEWILKRYKPVNSSRLSIFCYTVLILLSSMIWMKADQKSKEGQAELIETLNLFAWEDIQVTGTVTDRGFSTGGKRVYVIKTEKTIFEENTVWEKQYKLRLYQNPALPVDIPAGSRIQGEVYLYKFPEQANPHDFDYGTWLTNREISAHGELKHLSNQQVTEVIGWSVIRSYVQANIDQLFSAETAPLAKALILGFKKEIATETRLDFSRAGLSHIMAVSGLHVGFIVAPVWFMIPFFWNKRWGKWAGMTLLTLLLLSYAGLTGFSASVCRASLMAWLITLGKQFHKVRNSINLTAGAAIILLLINPRQLFEAGFQLSFAAVFIILLILPEIQKRIPVKFRSGIKGSLITLVIVSMVVQAGLFPVLTYYFGEFSIAGPIANAVVIPILAVAVPAGLLISIMPSVTYPYLSWFAIPVEGALKWVGWVADNIGGAEISYLTWIHDSLFLFFFWTALLLFIASLKIPEIRWKLLVILLVFTNLFLIEQTVTKIGNRVLRVTFLDVGQGDAIHIRTSAGRNIIVDTGRWSPEFNSGERTLIPYLRHNGVEQLDAVILTHPHADHIGGINSILGKIPVKKIYQTDYPYDSRLYTGYMEKAKKMKIPVQYVYSGDIIDLEEELRLYTLSPVRKKIYPTNPNNHSAVIKLVYGETSFLFTGDAEREQENEITSIYGNFLESTVYKMGHHGSQTSSTDRLLSYVNPKITVGSLGFRNRFGHPNREAVKRISHYSGKNIFTSLQGGVILESDGERVEIRDWK